MLTRFITVDRKYSTSEVVSLWAPYTLTEIIIPFLQHTTDNERTRMLWPHNHSQSKQETIRIIPEVKILTHETPCI